MFGKFARTFRKPVKCLDCGFLAVLTPSDELVECQLDLREDIAGRIYPSEKRLTCARWLVDTAYAHDEGFTKLNADRTCAYFFAYSPGHSPAEHKELQRERESRRLLVKAALLGAGAGGLVGMVAGIVVQLIAD
jgi:uncharacterized protein YfiM (DUF2279 family)